MRSPAGCLALATIAAGLLFAGCAATTPTRFYTLSSLVAAPGEASQGLPHLAIGVGPVTLPEYLNRPQIVTRVGSNRIALADFESWAEPLDGLFARILTENSVAPARHRRRRAVAPAPVDAPRLRRRGQRHAVRRRR